MSGILSQLTGDTFGFLANGARDEERDASVQAWTLYAHYQLAAAGTARATETEGAR